MITYPPFPKPRVAGILLLAGAWSLVVGLSVLVTYFTFHECGCQGIGWQHEAGYQAAVLGLWGGFAPGVFWVTRRTVQGGGLAGRIGLHLGAAAVVLSTIAVARAALHNVFYHTTDGAHDVWTYALENVSRTLHLDLVGYVGLLAVSLAVVYYLRQREQALEAAELERRSATLSSKLTSAQLQSLRTQVNPHFLFNALNTVSGLAEVDPQGTQRVVARLSDLLRRTLDSSDEQEVTLGEEIDFLEKYLDIMHIRFGERLTTSVDVPDALRHATVPAFVLQPLVENAFKHGVARSAEPGRVEIAAWTRGDRLCLQVRDNGPGCPDVDALADRTASPPPADKRNTSVGLRNIRSRLECLYEDDHMLRFSNAPNGGFVVDVCLPYQAEAAPADARAATASADPTQLVAAEIPDAEPAS
jgi:signal transduction histidine kinase